MNDARRKRLRELRDKLQDLREELGACQTEEAEAYENLPEGLQAAESGQKMEGNAQCLEDALDNLDSCISSMGEADIDA